MTGHDRLMTRHESENLRLLHASRSTASTGSRSTGAASNRVRFAGSVSCFTSIAIDRARRSSPVVRAICQRSIGSVSTAVNETGHAQRLNTLKKPTKWFFREEVDFLSSLAFVVN